MRLTGGFSPHPGVSCARRDMAICKETLSTCGVRERTPGCTRLSGQPPKHGLQPSQGRVCRLLLEDPVLVPQRFSCPIRAPCHRGERPQELADPARFNLRQLWSVSWAVPREPSDSPSELSHPEPGVHMSHVLFAPFSSLFLFFSQENKGQEFLQNHFLLLLSVLMGPQGTILL